MSARTDAEAEKAQAETGVTPRSLRGKLEDGVGASFVDVRDMSGECWLPFFLFAVFFVGFWPCLAPARHVQLAVLPSVQTRVRDFVPGCQMLALPLREASKHPPNHSSSSIHGLLWLTLPSR